MKKIFFVFAIAVMIVSCKSGSGSKAKGAWSDEEQKAFSDECVNGASAAMGQDGAKTYCDCMLGKIMAKYPDAEKVGEMNMDEMTSMAQDCI